MPTGALQAGDHEFTEVILAVATCLGVALGLTYIAPRKVPPKSHLATNCATFAYVKSKFISILSIYDHHPRADFCSYHPIVVKDSQFPVTSNFG